MRGAGRRDRRRATCYITRWGARWVYECIRCGRLFNASRSDAKTCGTACRVWLHRHPGADRAARTGWDLVRARVSVDDLTSAEASDEWIQVINLENEALSLRYQLD